MELTEGQKLASAFLLLGVTFVKPLTAISTLWPEHTGTCMFMYAHMYAERHWLWSKLVVMCQCDTEGPHNLLTFWLLAQIKTIKNQQCDNEPGWHTCSWRSNSKDVSQPPLLPHLIMISEWLRPVITDGHWSRADEGRVYVIELILLTLTQQWCWKVKSVLIKTPLEAGSHHVCASWCLRPGAVKVGNGAVIFTCLEF